MNPECNFNRYGDYTENLDIEFICHIKDENIDEINNYLDIVVHCADGIITLQDIITVCLRHEHDKITILIHIMNSIKNHVCTKKHYSECLKWAFYKMITDDKSIDLVLQFISEMNIDTMKFIPDLLDNVVAPKKSVKFLLDHRFQIQFDINILFMYDIHYGEIKLDIIEEMIQLGVDINFENSVALTVAIQRNNIELVKLLLNHGALVNGQMILNSLQIQNNDIIEILLENNNCNFPKFVDTILLTDNQQKIYTMLSLLESMNVDIKKLFSYKVST